ncbi:MAG TPA: M13 family metallopeptidase, partial [Rhodanobacteraceae bacterium]|nr:M13 family metallopeptidase [Rhodanobacteraceae bacterium]
MQKHLMTPIALAVAMALATAGCSHSPEGTARSSTQTASTAAPPPAHTAPAPAVASTAATAFSQPIAFELDTQYNPCSDFADYVNAKWNAAHPIPADETSWGGFYMLHEQSLQDQRQILEAAAQDAKDNKGTALEQKLGRLYAAGMDTATVDKLGYEPIKPELAKIDALKDRGQIQGFLDQSFDNGNDYVFRFYARADFKDAAKQIGYVNQGGLGLPTRDYYFKPQYKQIRDAYVAYIAKALQLVGTPEADAKKQADEVMKFETALAKASLTPTQLRDLDNRYNFVTVAEADKVSPHFNWEKFFKAQGVDVGKGFSLSQPGFIKAFDHLLASAPMSQWQAYLEFHLVSDASPALSQPFQQNHFDFYNHTLAGQPERKPRWKRVVDMTNDAMGMGIGELYVAKYFPPENKQRAEQLVTNVRAALKQHIENLDWMSEATKKKALEKWALFLPKIGYPDKGEWRDWSGLTIEPDRFFADLQAADKYNYHYNIDKIGKATDRKEWHMTPQTVNAYYDPTTNTINFPAAILQPPFFYAKGDDAVNYGGIGYVIGHESSHGFDDQGSQFDGHGNRANWWTPSDKKKFDER